MKHAKDLPDLADLIGRDGTVWLDCAAAESNGQSLLFSSPITEVVAFSVSEVRSAFAKLDKYLKRGHYVAGYSAYEAGYAFEKGSFPAEQTRNFGEELGYPLLWFGIYDSPIIVTGPVDLGKGDLRPKGSETSESERAVQGFSDDIEGLVGTEPTGKFESAVDRIRDLIAEGDVYQINHTTRFEGRVEGTSLGLYDSLRKRQPVEFGSFLRTRWMDVLSFSPELFFKREGGKIEAKPMKGTAPRGATPSEDVEIKQWLSKDAKNRAENLMIVDLLRNDLSVICEPGSVEVPHLFDVATLPTVHQMTSTIQGRLQPDTGLSEIFAALFPCGSITGAPKIRAMKRILELESRPRGVYCGAIGYAGPAMLRPDSPLGSDSQPKPDSTRAVFSVGIRTATLAGQKVTYGAGGGIVWDSDRDLEYEEAVLKTQFLTGQALEAFFLIETMLWDNGIQWIEFHLDRLQESARDLGFEFDRQRVQAEIVTKTDCSNLQGANRVRLLLSEEGAVELQTKKYEQPKQPIDIGLSRSRISSTHPLLRHKTTRRAVFERARAEARARDLYDVILTNERGEVTEGSISNLFALEGGAWYTSPLSSGLLPGVGRRVFMLKHSARERALTVDDLRNADRLIVTNALIGEMEAKWSET